MDELESPISHYVITANANTEGMSIMASVTAENDTTLFNMTGLFPGTAYEFTVLAVFQGLRGDVIAKGQPSDNITGTTVEAAVDGELNYSFQPSFVLASLVGVVKNA